MSHIFGSQGSAAAPARRILDNVMEPLTKKQNKVAAERNTQNKGLSSMRSAAALISINHYQYFSNDNNSQPTPEQTTLNFSSGYALLLNGCIVSMEVI